MKHTAKFINIISFHAINNKTELGTQCAQLAIDGECEYAVTECHSGLPHENKHIEDFMLNIISLQTWPPIKITVRHQRLIKIFHLFCASLWGGSTASVALVQCFFQPKNASELYASSLSVAYIDYYIVAPSAIGCLLTGTAYAALTKFGFLKYKWIVFKWITTIAYLTFGFVWYMPWLERLVSYGEFVNNAKGIFVETLPVYVMRNTMDIIQLLAVFFIVSISVIKPWGRIRRSSSEKRFPSA